MRGYSKKGERVQERIPYKPYVFCETKADSEWKSVDKKNLKKIEFDDLKSGVQFVEQGKAMQQRMYGFTNFIYPFINDTFTKDIENNLDSLNIGIIDIEVASDSGFPKPDRAEKEVTAITIYFRGKYVVIACGDYVPHRDDVIYYRVDSEFQLLSKFLRVWKTIDLDIITGWNVDGFDIPYLVNRIRQVLKDPNNETDDPARKLSPWNSIREIRRKIGSQFIDTYHIVGIQTLDYLLLYKKFSYIPQESYKLGLVASTDLGEDKIDYSEYGSIYKLYKNNHQKFIEYNVKDVELVKRLEEKHNLLALAIRMAFDAKVNFSDVFSPMRVWDIIIHNYLFEKKIAVDPAVQNAEADDEQYEGAYVKEPIVGLHKGVASYDVTSLYPSLIVQHNISPENYISSIPNLNREKLFNSLLRGEIPEGIVLSKDVSLCANGSLWKTDTSGIFPDLVKKIMKERKTYKKKMFDAEKKYEETKDIKWEYEARKWNVFQHARKIQINSLYGCLGNRFFRWYRLEAAEAITLTGQLVIKWVENRINKTLNEMAEISGFDFVIAMDTDSVYLRLQHFVQGLKGKLLATSLKSFCSDKIDNICSTAFKDFCNMLQGKEQAVFMKREAICDTAIWTGKKHYALSVWMNEEVEYDEPKLKFVGLEAIKTSYPAIARETMKKCIKIIMKEDVAEFRKIIKDFRKLYNNMPFDEISIPSSCNNLGKYSDRNRVIGSKTPMHVKGALFYNKLLMETELDLLYPSIEEGDKIRFAILKEPNKFGCNVISVPGECPKEFNIDSLIDRDAMFERTFLSPMSKITKVIGWNLDKDPTTIPQSAFI